MTLPAALGCLALYLGFIVLILMFFAGAREPGDNFPNENPQSDGLPLSARRPVPGGSSSLIAAGDTPFIAGTAQHHARRAGGIADLLHKQAGIK